MRINLVRQRSVIAPTTRLAVGWSTRALRWLGGIVLALSLSPRGSWAQTLELGRFHLVFQEDFSSPSISARGPGTRWTAHTPWGGDFGDATFVDPEPDFPFSHAGGRFRIELRKGVDGHWQSGLLASVDADGQGFSMQYGYFEMRAKFPAGQGLWPAFWLDSLIPATSTDPSIEIDVVEHYGKFPAAYNSTVTAWSKLGKSQTRSQMNINNVPPGSLSASFHTYGVDVEADWTVFYFDRSEMWRTATPPDHRHPLMILVDLGLGGGWPITQTPSPSYMYIDYVRAYAPTPQSNPRP